MAYMLANMHRPIDIRLCLRIFAIGGIWALFRHNGTSRFRKWIFRGLLFSTVAEATFALLQFATLLPSRHLFFAVTGTFGNPAPLAGFLSLGFVAVWVRIFISEPIAMWEKRLLLVCGAILFGGLLVADSRAAWTGIGVSLFVFHFHKNIKRAPIPMFLCAVCLSAVIMSVFYVHRPDSVVARLRVWNVCTDMVSNHPLTGGGCGSFNIEYMSAQTNAISDAPDEIRRAADDVNVAFNETVGILCEQGIVGFLFAIIFISLALRGLWREFINGGNGVYLFPIIALLVFAQFSYPFSVWEICILFFILAATGYEGGQEFTVPLFVKNTIVAFCFVIGLCFCIDFSLRLSAYNRLEKYCRLNTTPLSLEESSLLSCFSRHDPAILAYNAKAQIMTGDTEEAVCTINRLLQYRNETRHYMALGDAYAEIGKIDIADSCYLVAAKMRPGLLEPNFARFSLWQAKDPRLAYSLAMSISKAIPKI